MKRALPLLLVVLAACGAVDARSDADTAPAATTIPACRDAWGTVVTAEQWDAGVCVGGDDGTGWRALQCTDGRELRTNAGGFGYVGDVYLTHLVNLETGLTTYETEQLRCLGTPA